MNLEELKKHPKCYYHTDNGILLCGDCLEIMPEIKQISLLLTDIPYGLNDKMQGGTWGIAYRHSDMLKWDYVLSQENFDKLLKIGKIQIIFGANNYITLPTRCWIIWLKPVLPTLSDFEMAWTNIDFPSKIFKKNRLSLDGKHLTQKPIVLMIWCIELSKTKGIILDSFAGSGTTAIAAERLNRQWIGIEKEEKYCETAAKQRIELEVKRPRISNLKKETIKLKSFSMKGISK